MNNKGFGLQEVLVFIGVSMFILVVIAIYINREFKNINNNNIQNIEQDITGYQPSMIKAPKEYQDIENRMKEAAIKYNNSEDENTVISLKQLQNSNLIGKIYDPNDNSILCDGYVTYQSIDKSYTPYVYCKGMYTTELFDQSLLN